MKWEKVDQESRAWFQQITEDVYRILLVKGYFGGDAGLDVMVVDVVKQAKEIDKIQDRYKDVSVDFLLESLGGKVTKPKLALLYVIQKSQSIIKVNEKNYNVLLSYIKECYGLDIQE